MKARLAASAALALGIVVGASGCSMITYQATTEVYDPSDGLAANVGELDLRNILVVMEDGGDDGNLVFTVANSGDDAELTAEPASGDPVTLEVGANEQVVLGGSGEEPLLLVGIDATPGGMLDIYFHADGAEGVEISVPVLDGRLPEYRDLVP
ncbi:DNA modification methylase [Agromyces aerolatus]|uniref:DNA modification methylase n=1 Tax=Agromyces sp. LY-1074 TaxID=3074080 RepID=UPI0028633D14|nr:MULTISPECIES: DNA modification methylase [unclassified Agromyces]MDR5698233.1 DNA modification methylase [Agromyces sp. LY-1074]MDR5704527.1 DNA modification methylase [Agromyces sp. LY-1358]